MSRASSVANRKRSRQMIATIIAILTELKPILLPLVGFIAGWLFPSPIQKSIDQQAKTHDAERKADETKGDVSDLDKLP